MMDYMKAVQPRLGRVEIQAPWKWEDLEGIEPI
jgi:hypothetical protein